MRNLNPYDFIVTFLNGQGKITKVIFCTGSDTSEKKETSIEKSDVILTLKKQNIHDYIILKKRIDKTIRQSTGILKKYTQDQNIFDDQNQRIILPHAHYIILKNELIKSSQNRKTRNSAESPSRCVYLKIISIGIIGSIMMIVGGYCATTNNGLKNFHIPANDSSRGFAIFIAVVGVIINVLSFVAYCNQTPLASCAIRKI